MTARAVYHSRALNIYINREQLAQVIDGQELRIPLYVEKAFVDGGAVVLYANIVGLEALARADGEVAAAIGAGKQAAKEG